MQTKAFKFNWKLSVYFHHFSLVIVMSIPIMDKFIYVYCNLTIENLLIHQNNTIVDELAYSN